MFGKIFKRNKSVDSSQEELGKETSSFNQGLGEGLGEGFPSVRSSNARSDISLSIPTNPKNDLKPMTRVKLVKLSRALTRSLGVYTRLTSTLSRYAIGTGLMPTPTTTDEAWNKMAEDFFINWARNPHNCDVLGQRTFAEMQKSAVTGTIRDGEKFFHKQKRPFFQDGKATSGVPQLLIVDPLLIGGSYRPHHLDTKNKREIVDGIELGKTKRPIAYHVKTNSQENATQRVPEHKMMHVYGADNLCHYRGFTWLHNGQNDGIDSLDLKSIEKQAAKLQGLLAVVVKRNDDGNPLSKMMNGQNSDLPNMSGETSEQVETATPDLNSFLDFNGVKILDGLDINGLDLESPARPNLNMVEFLKALYQDMAWGLGLTVEFLLEITKASGANIRFVIQDAMPFIEDLQQMIITRLGDPTYRFVIASAQQAYEETGGVYGIPRCQDPEWWKCEWSKPKQPTVDIGRDGKLILQLIKAGLLSPDRFYKMQGLNPKVEDETAVKALKRRMQLCKKHGVPIELLNESLLSKTDYERLDEALDKLNEEE